jgi:peptidoglycan pentaglycine glycine transferase (the first glycine)
MSELTAAQWSEFVAACPQAHLLQTTAWGDLKAQFGWQVRRLAVADAGAQILLRRLLPGVTLAYLAKGPLLTDPRSPIPWSTLLPALDSLCHDNGCMALKIEPDLWEPSCEEILPVPPGLRRASHSIQPARTICIDLSGSEDEILARMKQKTRYNIRLAERKGVVVHASSDLDAFYRLMQATGARDGFGVHSRAYYQRAYELFAPAGDCALLVAAYQDQPLAALMVFAHGGRAWYFYGASSDDQRERMPTYLLQWQAMLWARQRGCQEYDLWGIPDLEETELETQMGAKTNTPSGGRMAGLWGVYRFKRGFGGHVLRAAGPWDRVYQPALYAFYRWWSSRRGSE